MKTPFGTIVVSDQVPEGTIYLVPPVTLIRYSNLTTGEVKEYFEWDIKRGAVVVNIGGIK